MSKIYEKGKEYMVAALVLRKCPSVWENQFSHLTAKRTKNIKSGDYLLYVDELYEDEHFSLVRVENAESNGSGTTFQLEVLCAASDPVITTALPGLVEERGDEEYKASYEMSSKIWRDPEISFKTGDRFAIWSRNLNTSRTWYFRNIPRNWVKELKSIKQ